MEKFNGLIKRLAEARLTIYILIALLIILIVGAMGWADVVMLRSAILACLGVNLSACLISRWKLWKTKRTLLIFHIGLIVLGILAILASTVYYHELILVAEGERGGLNEKNSKHGWWFPAYLINVKIYMNDFKNTYSFGDNEKLTEAEITVAEETGEVKSGLVSPGRSMHFRGFEIYTANERGFAPVFSLIRDNGEIERGVLNIPYYFKHRDNLSSELKVPGVDLKMKCAIPNPGLYKKDRAWELVADIIPHVEISIENMPGSTILKTGESMRLPGGTLRYDGANLYCGFWISYDPAEKLMTYLTLFMGLTLVVHYSKLLRSSRK